MGTVNSMLVLRELADWIVGQEKSMHTPEGTVSQSYRYFSSPLCSQICAPHVRVYVCIQHMFQLFRILTQLDVREKRRAREHMLLRRILQRGFEMKRTNIRLHNGVSAEIVTPEIENWRF